MRIKSSVLCGVEIHNVEIHALKLKGFSGIQILGLPLDWSRDIRERLRGCLESNGINPNQQRILIEVKCPVPFKWVRSPPSLLDLPILLGILLSLKESDSTIDIPQIFAIGELLLDGEVSDRDENVFIEAACYAQPMDSSCYLPARSEKSDSYSDVRLIFIENIKQLLALIKKSNPLKELKKCQQSEKIILENNNSQLKEQHRAQLHRLLPLAIDQWSHQPSLAMAHLLALSGRLNLLLVGSPGIGKSYSTLPWVHLLPPLTESQRFDRRLIEGRKSQAGLRPFRSPHHSCSSAGLTGGATLQPGEFTLSHHGVLFLDELLEFGRDRLDCLREPLETRQIHLAKAAGALSLPAHFQVDGLLKSLQVWTSSEPPCGV